LNIAQVRLVLLYTALNRRNPNCCHLLRRNHAFAAKEINKLSERCPIIVARPEMPGTIAQISCCVIEADIPYSHTSLFKPSTETCGDPDLPLQGPYVVTLRADGVGKV
jgi:hypothetical protein